MVLSPHPLDSEFEFLSLSVDNDVTIVSLNRPRKRNAIHSKMWIEIGRAFGSTLARGDGCRCILLKGEGSSFCAGIDVKDTSIFSTLREDVDVARRGISMLPKIRQMQACFTAVQTCPVPVVAAVHGNCIGAGVDLITCADVRLCAPNSVFSVREARLGMAADVGTLQRMPKICGNDSKVRELCLTGDAFTALTALEIGLVSRIAETSVVDDAMKLCRRIASNSPVAVVGTKASLNYSRDHSVADGLEHIASHNAMALMTDDVFTAFAAAREKSPPAFADLPPYARL